MTTRMQFVVTRPSRWPHRSCRLSTTCCVTALTTRTSAPSTSPAATRPKLQPGSQTASETSVIKSKSGLPHDNSDAVCSYAAIAVAASILPIVYHMLRDGTYYQDLGPEYFARRNPAKAAARLANRIRNLGYQVEIRAAA